MKKGCSYHPMAMKLTRTDPVLTGPPASVAQMPFQLDRFVCGQMPDMAPIWVLDASAIITITDSTPFGNGVGKLNPTPPEALVTEIT